MTLNILLILLLVLFVINIWWGIRNFHLQRIINAKSISEIEGKKQDNTSVSEETTTTNVNDILSAIAETKVSLESEVSQESKKGMVDIYFAYAKGDDTEGDSIFSQIQEREMSSEEKGVNSITFNAIRSYFGKTDARSNIEKIIEETEVDKVKALGYYNLAKFRMTNSEFENAIEIFRKGLEFRKRTGEDMLYSYTNISDCYFELKQYFESQSVVFEALKTLKKDSDKAKILETWAVQYKKRTDYLKQALVLQYALHFDFNNTSILFDVAYAFSNAGYNKLAILYYTLALQYNDKNSGVLNNIGYSYSRLGLKGKSMEFYFRADELNNSLASSNLAYNFIEAGFFDHADKLISKHVVKSDINDSVWHAKKELLDKKSSEEEKKVEVANDAKIQQSFLKNYLSCTVIQTQNWQLLTTINWKLEESNVELSFNQQYEMHFSTSWSDYMNKHSLVIIFQNDKTEAFYEKSPNSGGIVTKKTGLAYIDNDKLLLDVFVRDEYEKESIYFTIKGNRHEANKE